MTDTTTTERTARRLAQIAAVKKIIGGDANTMLIAAIFGEPFDYEPHRIRLKLREVMEAMERNLAESSDADCQKVARVMREHPRAERRGRRKDKHHDGKV